LGSESLHVYLCTCVKKDNLYVETFDEVEGAYQRVCSHCSSETSREKITKHLLKNCTVPAKLCGEKKTLEISFLNSLLYVFSTKFDAASVELGNAMVQTYRPT